MHWLIEAMQAGLENIDTQELMVEAARHVATEDVDRADRPGRRMSPTLLTMDCRLARLKRFRGHEAQPGQKWGATRQGRHSAGSNLAFFRGGYGEGMAVTALSRASRGYQVPTLVDGRRSQAHRGGLGLYPFDILGASPWMVFEAQTWTDKGLADVGHPVNWLAYPDLVMSTAAGIELVQMKCPSVYAFDRYKREGAESIRSRYGGQASVEMHVGRLMGLPIMRNHVLVFAFEGSVPSSDEARSGQEMRGIVETIEWDDGIPVFCERLAEEVIEDDLAANRGEWPVAYPHGTRWPCDYCTWPRASDGELAACEENEKWEGSRTPSTPAASSSATPGPSPSSPSSPTPSPQAPPPSPAPTTPEGSSAPRPLPSLVPPAHLRPSR